MNGRQKVHVMPSFHVLSLPLQYCLYSGFIYRYGIHISNKWMKLLSNIILSSYFSTPQEKMLAYFLKIIIRKHLPRYFIESRKCILYIKACKMKLKFSFHTHSVIVMLTFGYFCTCSCQKMLLLGYFWKQDIKRTWSQLWYF